LEAQTNVPDFCKAVHKAIVSVIKQHLESRL
jgi:hypothetical protein